MAVAPGEKIFAADIPLENYPVGRLVQSVAQSIPDAVQTALTWTTEDFDTAGWHDNAVNPTRITPNLTGYIEISGVYYSAAPTTPVTLDVCVRKNGAGTMPSGERGVNGAIAQGLSFRAIVKADLLTDYFEVVAFQDSAGAVNTNVSARFTSYVEWKYLRPL